jgi:hypothetical protein
MDFTIKSDATDMVKAQAGIALSDISRDDYISSTLDKSAGTTPSDGTPPDTLMYRPYLVAALTMWTSKTEQTLTEATGDAKFRFEVDRLNLRPPVESNLRMQQAIDVSEGLIIPEGWDVQTWLDALCGCKGDGEAVGSGSYVFGAMSA